jgi:hypothetical protein
VTGRVGELREHPTLVEPAARLRGPLCEVVSRCAALNDASAMLADLLADDPQTLLLLINAHLARLRKSTL